MYGNNNVRHSWDLQGWLISFTNLDQSLLCANRALLLFWVTRGVRNSNLQGVITHALRKPAFARTSTKNVWNAQNPIWSCAFELSITSNLITHILTTCHVKLTQSTALEQKRFDVLSLSPALDNLWLLLILKYLQLYTRSIPILLRVLTLRSFMHP